MNKVVVLEQVWRLLTYRTSIWSSLKVDLFGILGLPPRLYRHKRRFLLARIGVEDLSSSIFWMVETLLYGLTTGYCRAICMTCSLLECYWLLIYPGIPRCQMPFKIVYGLSHQVPWSFNIYKTQLPFIHGLGLSNTLSRRFTLPITSIGMLKVVSVFLAFSYMKLYLKSYYVNCGIHNHVWEATHTCMMVFLAYCMI